MGMFGNMKAIQRHANPLEFTKNVKRLEETMVDIVSNVETKEKQIEEIRMAFKDVSMVMMNKELKKINKDF